MRKRAIAASLRKFAVGCALALLALLIPLPSTSQLAPPTPGLAAAERIVAVGDIHGDYDAFVAILQQAGLIDSKHRWTGGNATLVQTGDFLDRGPKVREVMDLLRALEKQAPKKGGRAIVLLGNHEVMNLVGDVRYVAPENYSSFADRKSDKRRRVAYEAYVKWRQQRAQALSQPLPVFTPEMEKEWMEAHPLGFVEHREAFAPGKKYGAWLRERGAVARVGNTIFLHGGVSPRLESWTAEAIDQRIREEINAFDSYRQYLLKQKLILPFFTLDEMTASARTELEARKAALTGLGKTPHPTSEDEQHVRRLEEFLSYPNWFIVHSEGPLWFRGFAEWSEEEGTPHVTKLLANQGAAHFVVGHTPQSDGRIRARFEGKVFLIDTGMLASYYPGGRASALEIQDGRFTAIYLNQRIVLLDRAPSAPPAIPSKPGLTEGHGEHISIYEWQEPAIPPQPAVSPQAPPTAGQAAGEARRVWLGPDGKPLPFASDEEILEFLRTARVVSMKAIGQGITLPRKVLLGKDGVQMHAVFRDISEEKNKVSFASGQTEMFFRDSFIFECAAYELSRILGLDNVPPVVERTIHGTRGSLQIWVEKAMTETDRKKKKLNPPDLRRWQQQVQTMLLFDNLVFNTDRNQGNILYGPDWKLWLIDHTRAFRRHSQLQNPKPLLQCERGLWARLRTFDETSARQRLEKFLRSVEIEALLKRKRKLIEHIEKLIAQRGEEEVLFTSQ